MKIFLQFLILLLFLCSCKSEKQKQFEKDIIGEWNFAKYVDVKKQQNINEIIEEPPSPFFAKLGGFIFKDDKTLIDKIGFFDFYEGKSIEERKINYIGDSTVYKVENESLKIRDPIKNSWNNYKIISISKDTLILQEHADYYVKYYKPNYKLNPNETFDKIIISSSGCYGTCAISNIEFNSNGNIFYYGEKYNTINGVFTASISQSEYKIIETSFKKADINKLENRYSTNWTDHNTVTITFVKNNKIVKTISDYGAQSPPELIMAYRKAMYQYQILKLFKFKTNKDFPVSTAFSIEKGKNKLFLEDSERFLLLNEILKAKQVQANFKEKYSLTIFADDEKDYILKTDGKFFQFKNKIHDIAYNFIEINNLEHRTEPY